MIRPLIKFFFLIPVLLTAQIIDSVEVKGNYYFGDDEYREWLISSGITGNTEGLEDSVTAVFARALRANGYFDFSADTVYTRLNKDSSGIYVFADIKEGEPAVISRVDIISDTEEDSARGEEYFSRLEGETFIPVVVEAEIKDFLTEYEDEGYPFAAVQTESVLFGHDSTENETFVNLLFRIEKSEKSVIDKIEITGNDKTKDYVIIRNIRLGKERLYSREKVRQIPAILNRTRYFESVDQPQFYFNSDNEGVLLINVKEKETNNFDGIIGYVPDETEGSGYFTGFVNVSMINLFGTGRAAAFRWEKLDRNSQELEIKYKEPWLFGYPFNLGVNLHQRKQDTTYVQRDYGGQLEFLATENISASALLSFESTIPTDNENAVFTVYDASILTTGAGLTIDTRDDIYAPTGGIYFDNLYKFSQKEITGPEEYISEGMQTDINIQRLEVDLGIYQHIYGRQVAALELHAREMRGPFFEVSDLYRLGGAYTLRGYRENQFLGNRLFWSNLEYRYSMGGRSFLFLFFDTGYYLRSAEPERNILKTEAFKMGYGAGINLQTGIGVLQVNYALAEGDGFSDGKIHFGLLNDF